MRMNSSRSTTIFGFRNDRTIHDNAHDFDTKGTEVSELKTQVEALLLERRELEATNKELESAVARAKGNSLLIHQSYLRRLTQQTESTIQLSQTVTTIFTTVKEIARSYKEMLDAIQSVKAISHDLKDSFQIQTGSQDAIVNQVETVNSASSAELQQAQALKGDLDQIEEIRRFMSEAVETIDDISGRLSLLSINGRIEAAHAGRHGLGFGVVAHEMLGLQQDSQRIITSEQKKLKDFLPLMAAMQEKSKAVEAKAKSQLESLQAISEGSRIIREQNRGNLDHVSNLAASADQLVASIDKGQQSILDVEKAVSKVEKIFTEEVFVSKKMNDLDTFVYTISTKARSLAEAAHAVINEYQRISVLNGASYVWQGEAWLVTNRDNLPTDVKSLPGSNTWGNRVLVCIGQTDNNPWLSSPLSARHGIIAIRPLEDLKNTRSRLLALSNFLEKADLTFDDLKDFTRIDKPLEHATMSAMERFEGDYRNTMQDSIEKGKLICTFSFGGVFQNGDVLINHFLSTYQRTQADADKFVLLGESLILALQSHVENRLYWRR